MNEGYWYQFDTFMVIARKHGLDFYYTYDKLIDLYCCRFRDGNKYVECRLHRPMVQGWHGLTRNELIDHVIEPIINNVKRELSKL